MNRLIHIFYRRFWTAFQCLSYVIVVWTYMVRPAIPDTSDDDGEDYDPLPGRTEEQIEALIFNFDEVVETIILYAALFSLLLILLALAGSMRLHRWVGYTLLTIGSLAWFAFFEQQETGIYWIGLSPPLWLLVVVGTPLICAHFAVAAWFARWRMVRRLLGAMVLLPLVVLALSWGSIEEAIPTSLIILALASSASHLLSMPSFASNPTRKIYTRRNGGVVAVALALTAFAVFGELDEGFDASFAIRSMFVAVVILFAYFLVQSVVGILRERDASQRRALEIAQREAEQARSLLVAEQKYARAKEAARRHTLRLATASHDIRQPITSLRATMAAIAKDQSDDVQQQLGSAFDYLDQLAQSYMETDEPPNAPAPERAEDGKELVSARMLCDTLDRMFRKEAEAKGLTFEMNALDQQVRVAPLVLTRILSNLLSNAIQHTETGYVTLNAGPGQDGYAFEVSNSAAMHAEADGSNVFEHGVKGDASDGSGFGLGIIENLSKTSGLTFDWHSDEGSGTAFTVTV